MRIVGLPTRDSIAGYHTYDVQRGSETVIVSNWFERNKKQTPYDHLLEGV